MEDNADQREFLAISAAQWGYKTETASDGHEAIEKLTANPVHVVVTDLVMPRVDGVGLLRWLKERGNGPPTIVMTGYSDLNKAVTVVHELGAFWFLQKPFAPDALKVLLERAADLRTLSLEKELLQRRLAYNGMLGEMAGVSPVMQQAFGAIQQVAPTSASVLISGESGTGKELVAQSIHKLSPRCGGPFIAINCAAMPESLMESELFGHEKGAFTGATGRRAGCFELAQSGTLLLDEIGEMPPSTQAKLLRALESGRVRPLGAKAEIQVDVRVLAATNKALDVAVGKGELRQDLYYRLNVFHIHLSPLREHIEDLVPLAEPLLMALNQKHSCRVTGLDLAVLVRLQQHNWPGNVRELRNVLERAVILAGQGTITLEHLPPEFGALAGSVRPRADGESVAIPIGTTVAEAEKRLILKTLEYAGNDKGLAAKILGLSPRTLYNKLHRKPLVET